MYNSKADEDVRMFVKMRDWFSCRVCGERDGTFAVHHVIPRRLGGSNHPSNLVNLCASCHSRVEALILKGTFGPRALHTLADRYDHSCHRDLYLQTDPTIKALDDARMKQVMLYEALTHERDRVFNAIMTISHMMLDALPGTLETPPINGEVPDLRHPLDIKRAMDRLTPILDRMNRLRKERVDLRERFLQDPMAMGYMEYRRQRETLDIALHASNLVRLAIFEEVNRLEGQ